MSEENDVTYYRLTSITIRSPTSIATQAFITCQLCNDTISTVGGPDHLAICGTCVDAMIKARSSPVGGVSEGNRG